MAVALAFGASVQAAEPSVAGVDRAESLSPASRAPEGLATRDQARDWHGVGKLQLGQRGFCTGVLIEPRLVLTAAHCLFDRDTGARLSPQQITFQAGWRSGRAEAYRGVARTAISPEYIYTGEDELERVSHDLALLELVQPIRLPRLKPFTIAEAPGLGAVVSVVSYAHDRAEMPSIERDCSVIGAEGGAMVLTCNIDFGSSGAPVFQIEGGVPQVVSIISAKAELEGRKVALAASFTRRLDELRAQFAPAVDGARAGAAGVRVISGGAAGAGQTGGGAKFIRPEPSLAP